KQRSKPSDAAYSSKRTRAARMSSGVSADRMITIAIPPSERECGSVGERAWRAASGPVERLPEVVHQVVGRLDAAGDAHEVVGDTDGVALRLRHPGVRRDGGPHDEGLDAPEAGRVERGGQGGSELLHRRSGALEPQAQHPAVARDDL